MVVPRLLCNVHLQVDIRHFRMDVLLAAAAVVVDVAVVSGVIICRADKARPLGLSFAYDAGRLRKARLEFIGIYVADDLNRVGIAEREGA